MLYRPEMTELQRLQVEQNLWRLVVKMALDGPPHPDSPIGKVFTQGELFDDDRVALG